MLSKNVLSLAFAASCLLAMPIAQAAPADELITNGAQTDPGDHSPNWSAQRNVHESQNYERLLQSNPRFRQARMNKECGPITDPALHANCVSSFNGGAGSGSSGPEEPLHNSSGN